MMTAHVSCGRVSKALEPERQGWADSEMSQVARGQGHKTKELELELLQTQMAQKPVLRAEVYVRVLRASHQTKGLILGERNRC
jgi:hypothetical protein